MVELAADYIAWCTGCHGINGGLTLTAGVSYSELIDVPAIQALCAGTPRVDGAGSDPDNSVLVAKLEGATCWDQMPVGGPYFSAADMLLIRNWILAGAPNN